MGFIFLVLLSQQQSRCKSCKMYAELELSVFGFVKLSVYIMPLRDQLGIFFITYFIFNCP